MNIKLQSLFFTKQALTDLRNWLYDRLPTGKVDAWDCILLIKDFVVKMDEYIDALPEGHPPAVKGAEWIYTARRLPNDGDIVFVEYKNGDCSHIAFEESDKQHWLYKIHRWLDESGESPTAAGDGKDRETTENILFATGKFYEEQCTELADVILKELKGAGDGKEAACDFAEWIIGRGFWQSIYDKKWRKQTNELVADTTAQLYDIFKNRPQ